MIGKTILHYKILEKLGEGGMGVVYLAEDTKLDRNVAIKFLPPFIAGDSDERRRFEIEAKAAAALNHPNIATIHAIEEIEDDMFIVMEYIDGLELKEKLKSGPLPLEKAADIARQIARGLQAAHEKNIVHRDIKSTNIMLTDKGNAKIMDFGLAKVRGGGEVTKVGTTIGTAAYMSPEQAKGQEADNRSDIWSFGIVLYELLTGILPFKGDYDQAISYAILNAEHEPVTRLRKNIPDHLESIINKCLQKDPLSRYQYVDELLSDLLQIKERNSTGDLSTNKGITGIQHSKKSRPFMIPGIAMILILMLIASYYFLGGESGIAERIPIVVADFSNETEESELDGLSGLLITSLEQSKRLSVMSRARMFDILKQLGKKNVNQIDENLCREICKAANIKAMVTASVRKLGQRYSIDLKVLDARQNEYIFTAKEDGQGQESIFAMIDNLADKTHSGLEEKEEEMQGLTKKVADLTTSNLEAYQHYFDGEELINKREFGAAAIAFRKAIAIDSTFALAYYRLAYALQWQLSGRSKEPIRKAMQYIEKVPHKEQYHIRAINALVDQNLVEGLRIYKELLKFYPEDKEARYQVGDWSYHLNDYSTAIMQLEQVLVIDPTFERAYEHIIWTYRDMNQYEKVLEYAQKYVNKIPGASAYIMLGEAYNMQGEFNNALQTMEHALEVFPGDKGLIGGIGETYIFMNEFEKAEAEVIKLLSKNRSLSDNRTGYAHLSLIYVYRGQYRKALEMLDQIIEIDFNLGDNADLAWAYSRKAYLQMAGWHDRTKTSEIIDIGLNFKDDATVYFYETLFNTYILMGEYQQAISMAKKHMSILFSAFDQLELAYQYQTRDELSQAIRIFETVENQPWVDLGEELAQLYLKVGEYSKAIETVQKTQKTYWSNDHFPQRSFQYSRGFYLLGKIYEETGDTQLAIKNYDQFLNLWKDADGDLLDLIDAKERLEKLKQII
jgi:serine/threonine protein kinase/cytochrome c-type biogenesis protein CcmH/NrfG